MLAAPAATQQMAALSVDAMDGILKRMQATFMQIEKSRGSRVHLPKAELEMMQLFELARDFMMLVLRSGSGDRVALRSIFGGDCARISSVRAVLEATRFSEASREDQRLRACLSACGSVEKVLGDLGLGYALRCAQEAQKIVLRESLGVHPEELIEEEERGAWFEDAAVSKSPAELFSPLDALLEQAESVRGELHRIGLDGVRTSGVVAGDNSLLKPLSPKRARLELAESEPACEQDPTDRIIHPGLTSPKAAPLEPASASPFEPEPACEQDPSGIHSPCRKHFDVVPKQLQIETDNCPQEFGSRDKENTPTQVNILCKDGKLILPNAFKNQSEMPFEGAPTLFKADECAESLIAGCELAEPMHEPEPEICETSCLAQPSNQTSVSCERSHHDLDLLDTLPSSLQPVPLSRIPRPAATATTKRRQLSSLHDRDLPDTSDLSLQQAPLSKMPVPAATATTKRRPLASSRSSLMRSLPRSQSFSGVPERAHKKRLDAEPSRSSSDMTEDALTRSSGATDNQDRNAFDSLASSHQLLIQELFAHYVGPGGLSAGNGLSLSRFRRFLRDGGLLSSESGSESFVGDETTVTAAQADLILARAACATCPGVTARVRTAVEFSQALTDVAARACPELAHRPDQALDVLCCEVLAPLGKRILKGVSQDVRVAVSFLAEREVAGLLRRCHQGLAAVFLGYASGIGAPEPYRRGHWTVKDASRFAADTGLAADLSHSLLQRLFCACASYEAGSGRGEDEKVSFSCFLLALVATSQRIYGRDAAQRSLATLLRRVAVQLPGNHDIAAAAREALR